MAEHGEKTVFYLKNIQNPNYAKFNENLKYNCIFTAAVSLAWKVSKINGNLIKNC